MQLEEYNWQIQYQPGRENVNADPLSRDHPVQSTEEQGEVECPESLFPPSFQDDIKRHS